MTWVRCYPCRQKQLSKRYVEKQKPVRMAKAAEFQRLRASRKALIKSMTWSREGFYTLPSDEKRLRVVEALNTGMNRKEAAAHLKTSYSMVSRYARVHRDLTGEYVFGSRKRRKPFP